MLDRILRARPAHSEQKGPGRFIVRVSPGTDEFMHWLEYDYQPNEHAYWYAQDDRDFNVVLPYIYRYITIYTYAKDELDAAQAVAAYVEELENHYDKTEIRHARAGKSSRA